MTNRLFVSVAGHVWPRVLIRVRSKFLKECDPNGVLFDGFRTTERPMQLDEDLWAIYRLGTPGEPDYWEVAFLDTRMVVSSQDADSQVIPYGDIDDFEARPRRFPRPADPPRISLGDGLEFMYDEIQLQLKDGANIPIKGSYRINSKGYKCRDVYLWSHIVIGAKYGPKLSEN
jgi:hypothetical protein